MFNIGTQELLVILLLVFLLFGPRHIPGVAHTLGKGLGELRRTLQGVEESVRRSTLDIPGPGQPGDEGSERRPRSLGTPVEAAKTQEPPEGPAEAGGPRKSRPDPHYAAATDGDPEEPGGRPSPEIEKP